MMTTPVMTVIPGDDDDARQSCLCSCSCCSLLIQAAIGIDCLSLAMSWLDRQTGIDGEREVAAEIRERERGAGMEIKSSLTLSVLSLSHSHE